MPEAPEFFIAATTINEEASRDVQSRLYKAGVPFHTVGSVEFGNYILDWNLPKTPCMILVAAADRQKAAEALDLAETDLEAFVPGNQSGQEHGTSGSKD